MRRLFLLPFVVPHAHASPPSSPSSSKHTKSSSSSTRWRRPIYVCILAFPWSAVFLLCARFIFARPSLSSSSSFAGQESREYLEDGYTPDWDKILAPPPLLKQTIHVDPKDVSGNLQELHRVILTTGKQLISQSNMLPHLSFSLDSIYDLLPDSYLLKPVLIRMGDGIEPAKYPLLTKARTNGDEMAILMPIEYHRHFGMPLMRLLTPQSFTDLPVIDVPFGNKAPQAVWRGVTTGGNNWDPSLPDPDNHRRALVDAWGQDVSPKVDVGFTKWCQGAENFQEHWSAFQKPPLTQEEQLQYRYLLSVEGNDVATGLKWMLASNSVVIMPVPRREIWSRESLLKPYEHYIPVQPDWSDLLDRIDECEADLPKCQAIVHKATLFMQGFNDTQKTYQQAARRLREYLDKVTINVLPATTE